MFGELINEDWYGQFWAIYMEELASRGAWSEGECLLVCLCVPSFVDVECNTINVEDKANTTTINWCCSVTCLTLLLSSPKKKKNSTTISCKKAMKVKKKTRSCFSDWLNRTVASREITCPNYQIKELKFDQLLYRSIFIDLFDLDSTLWRLWNDFWQSVISVFLCPSTCSKIKESIKKKKREHKTELPSKRKNLEQGLLGILST